ncbi:MAG: hypothetical protein A2W69_02290 [Gammaproteobacteria bacterium RIFCSPLOWO2_02_47_7]|nr:MAG: hypothetical protein A2993_05190 [Gammaproteobacteria bacterium RIFCSPLOWO2_01_FULL_47_190]OGT66571.1 MAG: hypothetical protein A2W69_02290 [Gammaproteobacteria bacterium RIFCSPLOWO2_02_47_7]OGT73454.1 MAG: hypothetical protein A2W76_01000 [Gammaproteobacteria bacterium RIFCSPLOWO2_12_47_11]OGT87796.1 MAG: hypothetical protein A3G42_00335 [Gammaproteobacteria bacterium RIFCSPLOWO2_12_FULL_47_76]
MPTYKRKTRVMCMEAQMPRAHGCTTTWMWEVEQCLGNCRGGSDAGSQSRGAASGFFKNKET